MGIENWFSWGRHQPKQEPHEDYTRDGLEGQLWGDIMTDYGERFQQQFGRLPTNEEMEAIRNHVDELTRAQTDLHTNPNRRHIDIAVIKNR